MSRHQTRCYKSSFVFFGLFFFIFKISPELLQLFRRSLYAGLLWSSRNVLWTTNLIWLYIIAEGGDKDSIYIFWGTYPLKHFPFLLVNSRTLPPLKFRAAETRHLCAAPSVWTKPSEAPDRKSKDLWKLLPAVWTEPQRAAAGRTEDSSYMTRRESVRVRWTCVCVCVCDVVETWPVWRVFPGYQAVSWMYTPPRAVQRSHAWGGEQTPGRHVFSQPTI